eukprot:13552371-Alexandrium_andersonii.AAC.1
MDARTPVGTSSPGASVRILNCAHTQAAVRPAGVRGLNCAQTHRQQALGTRTCLLYTSPSPRD